MKILDRIISIFNDKQKRQLEELLFKKIGEGKIPWKDVYTETLKRRLPNLVDGLKLTKMPYRNKIDTNRLNEQLEDIEISAISLAAESEELDRTLSTHEMFRKDDVKSFFNIAREYVDMVNNEVKDYKTNNITVQNGIIELIPSLIIDYKIKSVEVEYFPGNVAERRGNDPDSVNISPGTDGGYWLSDILTKRKSTVGAKVIIGFNGNINFNKFVLNMSGKYPVTIENIEIKRGTDWIPIPFEGKLTEKFTQLITTDSNGDSMMYQSEYVRITFVQQKSDFIWETEIDNEDEAIKNPVDEKSNIVSDLLYTDEFELSKKQILTNVFSYIFGLYFVRVMLQKYSTELIGNFYSRKFTKDGSFKYITINSEEYKPSPFSIEYKIVQHDGSFASVESPTGNIEPGLKLKLLDVYQSDDMRSGLTGNVMKLNFYPITDSFVCKINGVVARLVEKFDEIDDIQVMISKNILFFNKIFNLADTVEVHYKHYTNHVIIQAILRTNSESNTVDSPKILDFNVELE